MSSPASALTRWFDALRRDLRYAARQLRKTPGFAATVIGTVALGIGACTVVFTAINSTVLRPMAGEKSNRDVLVHETSLPRIPQMQLSPPAFLDLQQQTKTLVNVSAWAATTVNLAGDTEPFQLRGAQLTDGVLAIWGMEPAMGRVFLPADYADGGQQVLMLSHALWLSAFGGRPDIIDQTVNVDGAPWTVVGVISPQFARYGSDIQVWMPLVFTERQRLEQRGAHYLQTMARLKPGVTLAQAQAELDVIAARLSQQYPDTNTGVGLLVRDFGAYINRSLAPMLYVLLGAVACVMLIACANVANLLLARATARQKEFSIRAALGAGRGRLVWQLLVESIVLAALGGGLGIGLAQIGLRFIRIYGPTAGTDLARLAYIELDPGVLAFTVGFSLLTGVVFGLAPAWLSSRVNLNEALKQGSRGSTDGGARGGFRNLLVVLEVSLALVLLAGAGLLVRSFVQLAQRDPGFIPGHVATLQLVLSGRKYPTLESRTQFGHALLERVQALPGVQAAALSTLSPFNNPGRRLMFSVVGRPVAAPGGDLGSIPTAVPYLISPDYFQTMGIRLLRGRAFTDRDTATAPGAIVINESLARQIFPNENPLGRSLELRFGVNAGPQGEIVGIVNDVMQGSPGSDMVPQFYLPWAQQSSGGIMVMARTGGEPGAMLNLLKAQVYDVDPNQAVTAVRTLDDMMSDVLARSQLMLTLLSVFGLIALVIAAVGIYGVMAYAVNQRTMEFGIRMALGASQADILRHVLRRGLVVIALGLTLGLAATLALGQVVQALLFDTSARDPLTLTAIVGLLGTVAFVACLLPARRATKVDPMVALRAE